MILRPDSCLGGRAGSQLTCFLFSIYLLFFRGGKEGDHENLRVPDGLAAAVVLGPPRPGGLLAAEPVLELRGSHVDEVIEFPAARSESWLSGGGLGGTDSMTVSLSLTILSGVLYLSFQGSIDVRNRFEGEFYMSVGADLEVAALKCRWLCRAEHRR